MLKPLFCSALLISTFSSCEVMNNLPQTIGVTQSEAGQGIREALDQGVGQGIGVLSKTDGFFGSQAYKLFLPKDAQRIESTLRQVGLSSLVDKAILQINRSAEDAVAFARPIFYEAIKDMTIADALNIIKGPKNAATDYFKQRTTEKLMAAFMPVIKASLDKFSATKYYGEMVTTYNNFPTTMNKLNPDLTSYVVGKTVDALFDQVAHEEENIRSNPLARTTDILKKVFGSTMKSYSKL